MADEQLRLTASLKDNASPGVRRIKAEMKTVRVEPGMAQAQKWVRGFNEDVAKFKKSSMTVASVMSSMGVGGLAAAGSIGTLAAAFKSLADKTLDMKELGREVGLTADEINAMNRAGQHFGFDPSEMEGAIKHFAGLMPEFKRGYGELNNILARQPDLIKRLKVEDTKTQIKEIFAFLDTIKNPQDRMVFERGIFGNDGVEKLFKDGAGGFEAQAEKFRQTLAPITEAAAAQAQQLRDAINDFNAAVDNLEMKAGPTVYRWMTAGVRELGAVLTQVEKAPGDVAAAAAVIAGSLAALRVRNRIVRGSALAGGGELRAAAGQLSAAGGGLDKTAVTLNEAAIALREAAIELRGRGASPGAGPGGAPEPGKSGAPEIAKDAPKGGILGKGGFKGVAGGIAEGVVGAVIYDYGEKAMDALLGWTSKNQATLDHATSLSNVYKDVRDQWFGGGGPPTPAASPSRGEDGNALRRNDEMPVARPALPAPVQAVPVAELPRPMPPAPFRVPAAYDREVRARRHDDLDGFVLGSLDKPVTHLVGTLKTAAEQAEADGIKPAAFHPAGIVGAAVSDPVAMLAAGVKQGMLEAMREWAGGTSSADASTARSGIIPASFGGGGGGGGNPALGGGGFGGANLSGGDAQGAEADRIRDLAKKYGIDPRVAVAVAKSEGLGIKWGTGIDHGTSFGAFQLHVGGGLGDAYQRETGHDPRDQANSAEMDDWALRYASKHGWGDWHGAARIGVRGMAGIGGRAVDGANLSGADGGGFTGKGDAVGIAGQMLGFGERQSAQALGHIMHAGEWCADFVNGVIEKSGGKGSGSAMANSFARWGKPVSMNDAKRGDVILENAHGRGINHVGLVESVDHDKLGRAIGIHMISGNYGHTVRRNMEPFGEIQGLRRGNEAVGSDLRAAAEQLRAAAGDQRQAARAVDKVPDWHDPDRPDLGAEKRKAEARMQRTAQVEGGIDAHVHLHDHRTSTRIERRGAVRDASINVRRAPQRTFTV